MTREKFDRLVGRLEAYAASHPRSYKIKVGLLALLGYGYLLLILAVVAAALAILAVAARRVHSHYFLLKTGLPLLMLAGIILRSLWVRLSPPAGIPLRRDDAGPLLDAVETIRRAVAGPRVHEILLTDEFNASVVQVPRLGVFGWPRNYLTVGLPLMHALSPAQFEAVLAHEIGHLSRAHGRFGARIYRIRRIWGGLMEALGKEKRWGLLLFSRFFGWYAPYFSAYSFVLARANEYAADRCSADFAGADAAAGALVAIDLRCAYLDAKYWPAVLAKVDSLADPPFPFGEMESALASGISAPAAGDAMSCILSRKTGSDDTHPSLADRLAAIGKEPRPPAPVSETAARRFLPGSVERLAARLDENWRAGIEAEWRERHARALEARKSLDDIEALVAAGTLPPGDSMRRAALTEEVRGEAAALSLYREIAVADANSAEACHAVGRILLSAGDEGGISHLEKAMELDAGCTVDACGRIYLYLASRGRDKEALAYLDRGERRADLLERAKAERDSVNPKDDFLPHGLGKDELDAVASQLARYDQLCRAYLVRKDVKLFPEYPQYVLGAAIRFPWYQYVSQRRLNNLHLRIAGELEFPFPAIVVNLSLEGAGPFRRKMKRVPGAEIYRRKARR